MSGRTAIDVICRRTLAFKDKPWKISINGWSVQSYRFNWYERFNIHNNEAKLCILNRIFEVDEMGY